MKLVNLFLIIILISTPFSKSSSLDDYSIDEFINYLKKIGVYDLIISIKAYYGSDVATIFCECITGTQKGNCRKLVRDYIKVAFSHNNDYLPPKPQKVFDKFISKYPLENLKTPEASIIKVNFQKCSIQLINNQFK